MTDGQAWATLERLAVPLESNVYPVVRRAQTQPPIYPKSESDAFETLRWVSGQDAIAQAVMHLEEEWNKDRGFLRMGIDSARLWVPFFALLLSAGGCGEGPHLRLGSLHGNPDRSTATT